MKHYVRLVKGDHQIKSPKPKEFVKASVQIKSEALLAMAKIMNKEKSNPDEILQSFIDKTFGK